MMNKVLIEVVGGNIQAVYSDEDTDIIIVDYDNTEHGDSPVEGILKPDGNISDFKEGLDPEIRSEYEILEELERLKI